MEKYYQVVIIGGGAAGLAAALGAWDNGSRKVLILERDRELGGILPQCVHEGFGLHYFRTELTGPEYIHRFIKKISATGIEVKLNTFVYDLTRDRKLVIVNRKEGVQTIRAGAVVLAMGCRERTREALLIPGTRPAGIFTAGTAQRWVNIEGYLPGERIVILGSGDIGLIMARRMTLEGTRVEAVVEILPHPSGLIRNVVQCLYDYQIPLLLSHTVVEIHGRNRVEGVSIVPVDKNLQPILSAQQFIPCDTLLLSVGLIPENELSQKAGIELDPQTGGLVVNERMETSVPGIFGGGNIVHVHDLVDYVTQEGYLSGRSAAEYVQQTLVRRERAILLKPGRNVKHLVPQKIDYQRQDEVTLYIRPAKIIRNLRVIVQTDKDVLLRKYFKIGRPAETIIVTLPQEKVEELEGDTVRVEIESKEEG